MSLFLLIKFKHESSNELLAFYLKFLYSHGFADSFKWIQYNVPLWSKQLSNDENTEIKCECLNALLVFIGGTSSTTCYILDSVIFKNVLFYCVHTAMRSI